MDSKKEAGNGSVNYSGQTPPPEPGSGGHQPIGSDHHHSRYFFNRLLKVVLLFTMITLAYLVVFQTPASPFQFFSSFSTPANEKEVGLGQVLERAAMADKTVIITTLNEAWIEPGSIFDLFLESFRIGNHTLWLLKHLVVVALDHKAFHHCLRTQNDLHCYFLTTKGVNFSNEAHFMTPDYLKMMWRRIDFLTTVLQMGYNFVFTDADIMWLRNPFPHFYTDTNFQISCDSFGGKSTDLQNAPNGGFNYVKSGIQTIKFYEFWYESRKKHPGKHDQDVLNEIKFDPYVKAIGLQIKFLDTVYFGGFCQPSKDLNLVCTMHANCCAGLDNKIHDLRILLDDWKKYTSLQEDVRKGKSPSWSVPQSCGPRSFHHHNPRKRNGNRRK
ncbi:Nucleotide-diphospho-sugar transferase family protein [Striga hermonthica]|uniref:Nucleotide-diphospho-sugar transferase family protein n=1 Tax=Striga hermonthica TaxID=68872 RepID=A0A9N7NJX8_STRHE|nr:Nucleotide-diphospho-sugar transferase family protein [Striga hermonthica]